mmetsp:Transcript_79005/g.256129  ORF Transcript_79005/g.256129 Transcript_79005/m.256129 type:complete len:566 (+) Transcript_79005:793-2490(+)
MPQRDVPLPRGQSDHKVAANREVPSRPPLLHTLVRVGAELATLDVEIVPLLSTLPRVQLHIYNHLRADTSMTGTKRRRSWASLKAWSAASGAHLGVTHCDFRGVSTEDLMRRESLAPSGPHRRQAQRVAWRSGTCLLRSEIVAPPPIPRLDLDRRVVPLGMRAAPVRQPPPRHFPPGLGDGQRRPARRRRGQRGDRAVGGLVKRPLPPAKGSLSGAAVPSLNDHRRPRLPPKSAAAHTATRAAEGALDLQGVGGASGDVGAHHPPALPPLQNDGRLSPPPALLAVVLVAGARRNAEGGHCCIQAGRNDRVELIAGTVERGTCRTASTSDVRLVRVVDVVGQAMQGPGCIRSKALLAEGRGVSPTAPKQWPPLARRPERRQRSRRKLHASSDAAKAALAPTSAISPSSPCLLPRSSNPGTADALQPSLLLQVLLGARLGRPLPVARGEALGVGLAALPVSLDHRKQSPPLDLTPLDAHSLGGRDRPTNHAPWHLVPGQGLRGWRPLAGAGAGERRQPQRALGIGPRGPGVSPHIQRSAGRPDLASSDVVRPNEVRVFTQLPRAETA